MSSVIKLHLLGQSIWYDNLKRSFIQDGTIQGMIERREILGITSNPSIFEKAITGDDDYAADLKVMSWAGLSPEDIFYHLAIKDIQDTADLFLPYYQASNGADGFVSLEVNPNLANNTQATISEAKWLWSEVNRPNLMVKIPATKAGLPAITEAIAAGVNVNVTLIFSCERYQKVMDAYLSGLEKRLDSGQDISQIASVASFFVSRLDTKADERLKQIIDGGHEDAQKAEQLIGKMAVSNTKLAYQAYQEFFSSDRYQVLAEAGGQKQRPLWASTGTKDPAYRDIKYVEELVAENTVNTVPPQTLEAYLDHGDPGTGVEALKIMAGLDQAKASFDQLAELGISMDEITQELEDEGVRQFAESFKGLLNAIEDEQSKIVSSLGSLADEVVEKVEEIKANSLISRVHRNDPTVWAASHDSPAAFNETKQVIQTRLGWLDLPVSSQVLIPELEAFAKRCRMDGFKKVLVMGMGGSSLAPETMSLVLGPHANGLELRILDSTLPDEIRETEKWVDYPQTLFILASKSGKTTEPLSMFAYFRKQAENVLGADWVNHFVAITDPGSSLAKLGESSGFRAVFTADPNVGGRYSALSHFGLVPAALMGIDLKKFLSQADAMADRCSAMQPLNLNTGALLGIIMGISTKNKGDKLTLLADQSVAAIGAWLEQLVAESSGKNGTGIIPVADEPLTEPGVYSKDRLFVYLRDSGELDDFVSKLKSAGHSMIVLDVDDLYDLAGQFYGWEFAIAIACSVLGVNAFDQPDVQDSKDRTKEKLMLFQEKGQLEEPEPIWEIPGVKIMGQSFDGLDGCVTLMDVIESFTGLAEDGDYIAINAYLPRNEANQLWLTDLRRSILDKTGKATTLGFGPRFLHSTGQLHKGGPNNGLFLQITQDDTEDIEIPGQAYTFGVLARAQAQGDLDALLSKDRRAIRIHLRAGDMIKF